MRTAATILSSVGSSGTTVSGQETPECRGRHPRRSRYGRACGDCGRSAHTPPRPPRSPRHPRPASRTRSGCRAPGRPRCRSDAAGFHTVHPIIGDPSQPGRSGVAEPGRFRLVNGLEDQLLDLGGDPRRKRSDQPYPAPPRAIDCPDRVGELADLGPGRVEPPVALLGWPVLQASTAIRQCQRCVGGVSMTVLAGGGWLQRAR